MYNRLHNGYGGRYPHFRQYSHYLYSAIVCIVITRRLRIAHVQRLSHQLFFMQLPSALSLPAFQLLQSHTTQLTQLRILFPTVSLGDYTTYSWSLLKRVNHSLIPIPE